MKRTATMHFFVLVITVVAVYGLRQQPRVLVKDPDCDRRTMELIASREYPGEEYTVITDDGYILTIQRIPYAKGQTPGPRPSILLQHGLEGSSSNFVDNYAPYQSLGFFLADAGFDVWLANSRGNSYSKGHVSLSPEDEAYWKFSWDEMAKYDLPKTIEKVLEVSKNKQIFYLGHSQGSLIGFAHFSQNTSMASKIKKFFAMAPIAHLGHINSPLKLIAPYTKSYDVWSRVLGTKQFKPGKGILDVWTKFACSKSGDTYQYLCSNTEFLIYGHNATLWNHTRIPDYLCHNPDSTSARNVAHFGQMISSNKMQMYSYGTVYNIVYYGTPNPPVYDPSEMKVRTVFFTGGQDKLSDTQDDQWLEGIFKDAHTLEAVYNLRDYGHLDFIFALNAPQYIYGPIVEHMRE